MAREILPYVVMIWATFALLGGALESTQNDVADQGGAAMHAGIGVCAVTIACIAGAAKLGGGRIRGLLRRFFGGSYLHPQSRSLSRPVAYSKPPTLAPCLERLQVLRV